MLKLILVFQFLLKIGFTWWILCSHFEPTRGEETTSSPVTTPASETTKDDRWKFIHTDTAFSFSRLLHGSMRPSEHGNIHYTLTDKGLNLYHNTAVDRALAQIATDQRRVFMASSPTNGFIAKSLACGPEILERELLECLIQALMRCHTFKASIGTIVAQMLLGLWILITKLGWIAKLRHRSE
nr:TPA_asm: hypothetical protein [Triaenorhabdovirus 1]